MVHYRRNMADTQLRELEREYEGGASAGTPQLLKRIDILRHRAGLPPHLHTRLRVAEERLDEMNYQSYMIMRVLLPRLNGIFEVSNEVRINAELFNDRQYIPQIQALMELRDEAMEESGQASRGQAMRAGWKRYLKGRKIKLLEKPTKASDVAGSMSFAPHLQRADMAERFNISEPIRREADREIHTNLNELSRLGVLNGYNLLRDYEDREDELAELLWRIEQVLNDWDLAKEEIFLSRLGDDPTPEFAEDADRWWWRHIN